MKHITKISILAALALSMSLASCNKSEPTKTGTTPVVTNPGLSQPTSAPLDSNTVTWAEASAKLPRTFPEVTLNGSSNVNKCTTEMGTTTVIWATVTEDNYKELSTFLTDKLGVTFEADGEKLVAYDVTFDNAKYNISISYNSTDSTICMYLNAM